MGDVLDFPRVPSWRKTDNDRMTEDEHARYLEMREQGFTEDEAVGVVAVARWVKGVRLAD